MIRLVFIVTLVAALAPSVAGACSIGYDYNRGADWHLPSTIERAPTLVRARIIDVVPFNGRAESLSFHPGALAVERFEGSANVFSDRTAGLATLISAKTIETYHGDQRALWLVLWRGPIPVLDRHHESYDREDQSVGVDLEHDSHILGIVPHHAGREVITGPSGWPLDMLASRTRCMCINTVVCFKQPGIVPYSDDADADARSLSPGNR